MVSSHQVRLKGFTLIEVLVAISIFMLTVSMGVLALTSMSNTSQRIKIKEQSVQSAYFLLDSISRSIRMGTNYKCADENGNILGDLCDGLSVIAPGISYIDQDGIFTTIYFRQDSGQEYGALYRKVSTNPESNPIEEKLHDTYALKFTSGGFIIDGADLADQRQPFVSIRLISQYSYRGEDFTTPIQTTLTQRQIDAGGGV